MEFANGNSPFSALFKYFLHESVCCFEKFDFVIDDDDDAVAVVFVFKSLSASVSDFTPV